MPAKPLQTALGSLLIQKQYPNSGTMILDATYAPQQISYPQDINLLNEARVNLENIIDSICYEYNYYKPRMYRDNARRDYLSIAMNVDHLTDVHAVLFLISIFSRYKRQQKLPKISIVNSFA